MIDLFHVVQHIGQTIRNH
ncbi:hypothetical protein [Enterococcus sp. DIV0086]